MKVIKLYKIFKYKIYIAITFAILIACILIFVSGKLLFSQKNRVSLENENKLNYNQTNYDLNSYFSNSKITIFSNKNENKYLLREKYKKINGTSCYILEINNQNDISKFIINGDKIKIENDMQKNKYIIENNYLENNLISINTYLNILNYCINKNIDLSDKSNEDSININTYKTYTILLDQIKDEKYIGLSKSLNRINIVFDDEGLYKIYAYDKKDKLYVDIEINDFINDYSIDDYEFDF